MVLKLPFLKFELILGFFAEPGISHARCCVKIWNLLIQFIKIERQLYLDMSEFSQSSKYFKTFLDHFKQHSADTQYEESLVYVDLPDLNTFENECPHDWVREFFSWLSGKGVKNIKKLHIPDSISNPMCEELVGEAILSQFKIQSFHWRKLDVNLDVLTKFASDLTEISLFSSGNWSVLYHWASQSGLATLPRVCIQQKRPYKTQN